MAKITKANVAIAHKKCIAQVAENDYYPRAYEVAVGILGEPVNITDASTICRFWNIVWGALPYTAEIHRAPFYLICDLAEGYYLDDGEDDYV